MNCDDNIIIIHLNLNNINSQIEIRLNRSVNKVKTFNNIRKAIHYIKDNSHDYVFVIMYIFRDYGRQSSL